MTLKNSQWGKVTPAFQIIKLFMFCHIFFYNKLYDKNMYYYPLWKVFCVKMDMLCDGHIFRLTIFLLFCNNFYKKKILIHLIILVNNIQLAETIGAESSLTC